MVLEAAVTPGRSPFRHHTFYCSRHCKHLYIYIYVLILFSYVFTNSEFGLNVIAMNVYASILHSMCVIVLVMLGISSWCCSSVLEWQTAVLAAKSWIYSSGNVWWGKHQFGNQWGLCSTCTCVIRFNGGIACTYVYIFMVPDISIDMHPHESMISPNCVICACGFCYIL